jgi:hypothetical protein
MCRVSVLDLASLVSKCVQLQSVYDILCCTNLLSCACKGWLTCGVGFDDTSADLTFLRPEILTWTFNKSWNIAVNWQNLSPIRALYTGILDRSTFTRTPFDRILAWKLDFAGIAYFNSEPQDGRGIRHQLTAHHKHAHHAVLQWKLSAVKVRMIDVLFS